jgi:hypothetical protein
MKIRTGDYVFMILLIVAVVGVSLYLGVGSFDAEGFRALMPGGYPVNDDKPLLKAVFENDIDIEDTTFGDNQKAKQAKQAKDTKEGFRPLLSPGYYPLSDDKPLLYDVYKVKANPGITKDGIEDIYKDYPIQPANSLDVTFSQYWPLPTDGTCSPPEICNGLYEPLPPPPPAKPVQAPSWCDNRLRVNFYNVDYKTN